ncbi:UNVERIFIED_CONTAM: hypothetical protein Sradi_2563400 [Sesamum radiatum]|uniref:Uncharacterized protein n=1 Tax=Sesamum radiatum TaxID=300843 RepID=A0AAW2S539_SESRA
MGGRVELGWLAPRMESFLNERPIPNQVKKQRDLPIRFLKSQKSPKEFAEELVAEADQYNGFNLIVADLCSMTMLYITNRPKDDGPSITEVAPGIHVLSNAKLDTPWPKAQRLRQSFEDVVQKCCDAEISMEEITEKLMTDTTKDDDEQELPHIYPPAFEYLLSAIFVEADTPSGRYGTRSISAVALKTSGAVSLYERSLEDNVWKEKTINYYIERERRGRSLVD